MTRHPLATIVVVARERFSYAEHSLANIYEETTLPFKLVYVSGGTPAPIQGYLERESEQKGFRLISRDQYLSPNKARNLGLSEIDTKYVVFIDNDALVKPGWLDALVQCAEETGAWVVGPLYLIGEFERANVHMAGGFLQFKEKNGKRILYDEQYLFDAPLDDVRIPRERRPCDYMEFHCMLVRTDTFERLGPLDERLLSHHEHIDLCLAVRNAGGLIYLDPKAVTSYVPPPPCEWWDLPYYMLRWSEAWNVATVRHFNEKWGIDAVRDIRDESDLEQEDTIIRWARGHRRLMTGLRVPEERADLGPRLPLEQAELMVAMIQSVDRDRFDLVLTTGEDAVIESGLALDPEPILAQLPRALQMAEKEGLNVMIRTRSKERPDEPAVVRIDDLDAEGLRKVQPYAFLTLETGPRQYQCWLAVARGNWRSGAALRRLVGVPGNEAVEDGAVALAGTKRVRGSWSEGGGAHRVRLVQAVTGLLVTARQLEGSVALPYLALGHIC